MRDNPDKLVGCVFSEAMLMGWRKFVEAIEWQIKVIKLQKGILPSRQSKS